MARKSTLAHIPSSALETLQSRPRWTPCALAGVLGCSRETVYRHFPGGGQILTQQILAAIEAAHERGHAGETPATDLGDQG